MDSSGDEKPEELIDEAEEDALLKSDDECQDMDSDSNEADVNDDLEDSDKAEVEFKQALNEVETNKYNYDKYVKLCILSHETSDLNNIRQAYDLFASVYPLSPELWLQYLTIETNVALSATEIKKVENLFHRALEDYYSVDIAFEFASFAERCESPENIWKEILGTYALHPMKGRKFFEHYRKYLSQSNNRLEEREAAYVQSFLRELRYPLLDMEESYIEFKVFYEKNKPDPPNQLDWGDIDRHYFKAKEHLQKILPFEEQLSATNEKHYSERAQIYTNYIKESDKFLEENVLQTVYERMVADCCLNAQCWLTYIDFIDYRDEFGRPEELQNLPVFQQDAVALNKRALRNCTWSPELYIKYMQLLEKREKPREEVQQVLESAMAVGLQTAEAAVAIWTEYLTYLRRQTDWENEQECEILRKNFNLAWTILGQQWGVLADCNCEILQFWGRLEYAQLKDPKRGKELWTTVMESSDNAMKSGMWIEFAQLEMNHDLESTRKIYRKALRSTGLDNVYVLSSAWQRFERCKGTMNSLSSCLKESNDFLQKFWKQQKSRADNKEGNSKEKSLVGKRKAADTTDVPPSKKKSTGVVVPHKEETPTTSNHKSNDSQVAFKEHENQEIDVAKDHLRIFLSNLDYNLTADEIRAGFSELKIAKLDLICSANGRSRGFAYIELENADAVKKALDMDRRSLNGRPVYISSVLRDKEKRQKFKYSGEVEPKKLFVRGLPPDVTKEELEEIYGAYGELHDVRLVHHKSGKFKNIAYVEFKSESAASKAVFGTNDLQLRGHTISAAISAPPPKSTVPVVNPAKLLGVSTKRKNFDPKPRLSLIPNVVRKKQAELHK